MTEKLGISVAEAARRLGICTRTAYTCAHSFGVTMKGSFGKCF